MNFKEISKKYPEAFSDVRKSLFETNHVVWYDNCFVVGGGGKPTPIEVSNVFIFGYLILEYFPAHGIEIGRAERRESIIYCCKYAGTFWAMGDSNIYVGTPEEAIEKAFEIREGQL